MTVLEESYRTARRIALIGMAVSALLACSNITIGLLANSTSVVATGFEFAGDVLASSIVLIGMSVAARPADENHPYGHGRFETLAAFVVGVILAAAGVMICNQSRGPLERRIRLPASMPLLRSLAQSCCAGSCRP